MNKMFEEFLKKRSKEKLEEKPITKDEMLEIIKNEDLEKFGTTVRI